MKEIQLSRGYIALVDDEDFQRVSELSWHIREQQSRYAKYAIANVKVNGKWVGKTVLLHRFILNLNDPNVIVDHIDSNGLNNTKSNLRICSNKENRRNSKKYKPSASSLYKGVHKHGRSGEKCWIATVTNDKKIIYRKAFYEEVDAARAYDDVARKYFGEFANTNFPEDDIN